MGEDDRLLGGNIDLPVAPPHFRSRDILALTVGDDLPSCMTVSLSGNFPPGKSYAPQSDGLLSTCLLSTPRTPLISDSPSPAKLVQQQHPAWPG
jgi:hypothetical protein